MQIDEHQPSQICLAIIEALKFCIDIRIPNYATDIINILENELKLKLSNFPSYNAYTEKIAIINLKIEQSLASLKLNLKSSDLEECLIILDDLLKIQPDSAICWLYIGQIAYLLKEEDKALECFERSLDFASGFTTPESPLCALLNIGKIYANKNKVSFLLEKSPSVMLDLCLLV